MSTEDVRMSSSVARVAARVAGLAAVLLGMGLSTPSSAAAQLAPAEAAPPAMRAVSVPPRTPLDAETELGAMEIDGALDEPDWQGAQVFRGFTQREPVEGEPAENDTEVRVLLGE